MVVFFYGVGQFAPGGGKMAENIVLSKSDLLRVIDSIDSESDFPDLDPEDIAEEVEIYAEGTE